MLWQARTTSGSFTGTLEETGGGGGLLQMAKLSQQQPKAIAIAPTVKPTPVATDGQVKCCRNSAEEISASPHGLRSDTMSKRKARSERLHPLARCFEVSSPRSLLFKIDFPNVQYKIWNDRKTRPAISPFDRFRPFGNLRAKVSWMRHDPNSAQIKAI